MSGVVLAVDPGAKSSGWALYHGTDLEESGTMKGQRVEGFGLRAHAKAIFRLVQGLGRAGVLVIETQYVGAGAHATGMLRTLEARCAWQTVGELLGWDRAEVAPLSWQAHFGLTKLVARRRRGESDEDIVRRKAAARKLRKAASLQLARKLGDPKTDDEADAILLGLYWTETGGKKPCLPRRGSRRASRSSRPSVPATPPSRRQTRRGSGRRSKT